MFSVIIPLYNKEESILNTLNSVINQSYVEFEVIIVNDGSTDNSLAIVQNFNDPRIKIIDKPNGGVSSARNRGVKEATKAWITFLDGDDLWDKDHLNEYYKAIISNPDLNWLFSGFTAKNKEKKYEYVYSKKGVLGNVFKDLVNGLKIHTSTVCVKKSLFIKYEDLFFTEGINNSEDREVWYKLCCLDKTPFYIQKSLSIYTLDINNSLTKSKSISNNSYLKLYERLCSSTIFLQTNIDNRKILKKYIENFNKNAIRVHYINNNNFEPVYVNYISNWEYFLLKYTIFLPSLLKKIIVKFLK
ncbi:glycosyltransferase family A protein [Empedobacter sp. 189-2]|uniref:glycosyltransferase family 2 protein n=1 Tax=Empedobacter sp. 189-2 TaxID=2746724 RepID=UPI002578BE32|nr:glycosyltransferase family A protein [Empedobacter sp. 189-2]MDM1541805.1 glycosyltransferase family 2 protein [Empedobacter sp. 189-2]